MDLRTAGRKFARRLIGPLGPRDVHSPARHGRALAAEDAQRHGWAGEIFVQDREEAEASRFAWPLGVERFRPGKQDVAAGEVERAGVAVVWVVGGKIANRTGREVDLHGVAKCLR